MVATGKAAAKAVAKATGTAVVLSEAARGEIIGRRPMEAGVAGDGPRG